MDLIKKFFFRYLPCLTYCRKANNIRHHWFCYRWIKKNLSLKNDYTFNDNVLNNNVVKDESIFVYWKQGWTSAPKIVEICKASLEKHAKNHPIVFLDETNIGEYVSFPDFILEYRKRGIINEALFSDILRLNLLIKYGGIWCDATCFFTDEIPAWIEASDFFMFDKLLLPEYLSPIVCSNWFIKSKHNNVLLKNIRDFLYGYYNKNEFVIHYFMFHLTLSAFVNECEDCRSIWSQKMYMCNMAPHVMQYSFGKHFSEQLYSQIAGQSFIHKLTYKYSSNDEKSLYHYLLSL